MSLACLRLFLVALIFLTFLPHNAKAEDPVTTGGQSSVGLDQEKEVVESKKAALEKEARKIQDELNDTQSHLVKIAGEIKKNEKKLSELDKRLGENRTERDEIQVRLKKDKNSIGTLVLALERLDRTPPEAILARPGAPLETAQSAMLLQGILPDIYGRAEKLKKDLARLDEILRQIETDKTELRNAAKSLEEKHKEIAGLLKKRKGLYAKNQTDLKRHELALREISARAQTLRELVARVDQYDEEERTRADQGTAMRAAAVRPTPIPRPGSAQLPVSGIIRVGYQQVDDIGAESQGLTIEGRSGALVVAPMGGVVRYTGPFKGYGRIIIVEHQKDYHSLIAGLDRIDTVVGQSVAAGEPVGVLPGGSSDGGKPTLYYELRLNGEPVNPARKFAGL